MNIKFYFILLILGISFHLSILTLSNKGGRTPASFEDTSSTIFQENPALVIH